MISQETIEELYDHFLAIGNITTDTRNCKPGSLFVALKGERFDGNTFIEQALLAGCSLTVSDDLAHKGKEGVFWVEDTLLALQKLASHHRQMLDLPIIGITGTNGKTTTKELISAVLRKKFNVFSTLGNLNNHIGVPLTLLSMNNATEIGVVEMGANHPGEIAQLCNICLPNYGIITNIGNAHLEGFGSYEGVKNTKNELYRYIASHNGSLFVNANDETLLELSTNVPRLLYANNKKEGCLICGYDIVASPFVSFSLSTKEKTNANRINTHLLGKYNIDNILAACSVGFYFGIDPNLIGEAIEQYVPSNNRSQLVETPNNKVLMDAYNANPSSMKAAIENFVEINHPSKTLILGGMKELGDVSAEEHHKLAEWLKRCDFKQIYLVGEEFENIELPDNFEKFATAETLCQHLRKFPISGSFVLVKGSRSNKLETVQPFL